jgi:hypothetical protein
MSEEQTNALIQMVLPPAKQRKGKTDEQIAKDVGITPSQVAAVAAQVRTNAGVDKTKEMKYLADVLGKYGVSFNPELNSEQSANLFLARKLAEADKIQDPKAKANALQRWSNYVVDYEDFDNNTATPENLMIRNKVNLNDMYPIDGYRLGSKAPKMVQRGVYDVFKTKLERSENKQYLPEYKRWLRKYLTPEQRLANPYTPEMAQKFATESSISNWTRDLVSAKATSVGFVINKIESRMVERDRNMGEGEENNEGEPEMEVTKIQQLSPQNRMKVLAKISSFTYKTKVAPFIITHLYPGFPSSYNFITNSSWFLKVKQTQKDMREFLAVNPGLNSLG